MKTVLFRLKNQIIKKTGCILKKIRLLKNTVIPLKNQIMKKVLYQPLKR